MKKLFTLSLSLLFVFALKSQHVSFEDAQKIAQNFFSEQQKSVVECSYIEQDEQVALLYFFNATDAYVVISADKSCPPILAFSKEHRFNENDVIEPVKMWLDYYKKQIKIAKEQHAKPSQSITAAWNRWLNGQKSLQEESVEPFLLSKWGQEKKYNFYCPQVSGGPNGRAVTGCVATAMAQLIYYFRFPETGTGMYSYEDENLGTLSANFGETTYDYAAMTDEPKSINLATSVLMYHCGVSVDMVYGADGSGMYNHKAAYSLRTYFKYAPETEYLFRDSTTLDWDSVMVNHLQRRIPLYYAGWSVPNIMGHAFICDGYILNETDYYYHFNFGWDGSYDGYFYTNNLIVGGNNFNLAQELIINAYPDTINYSYPNPLINGTTMLSGVEGSFADGSSPCENYADNVDYTWIIKPDVDSITKIDLTINFDIAQNDSLFIIFDNETIENVVITNDSASNSWTYDGNEITVKFRTDNSVTKNGFSASYVATLPAYCGGKVYTDASGIVEDGSGDKRYNNFTNCNFMIYVADATSITIDFTKFETENEKDFLYIYDRLNGRVLMETLSGNLEQTHFTFNTNVIELIFVTDELHTFDGWEFNYTSSNIPINELENALNNIILYPNPTKNQLHISNCQNIETVRIFDISGKTVYYDNVEKSETIIDVSDLLSGIYFIEIHAKENVITKKFVKQ